MVEHKDISGRAIEPGDHVVYATSFGSHSVKLKYARVVQLRTRQNYTDAPLWPWVSVVAVDQTWRGEIEVLNKGRTIAVNLDAMLIITSKQVPSHLRSMLAKAWRDAKRV